MELSDVDLGVRLVLVLTNLAKERLVVGRLSEEQGVQAHRAVERLYRSKLYLVAGSGYTSGDVRAHLLRAQAAEGARPALLVVDYVQLLADQEGDGRSRERNVGAAAKALKNLAGELGVPVLALVQLNRNRAQRADKRPQLADLPESGDLENTADSVIGLYRDEMDNPSQQPARAGRAAGAQEAPAGRRRGHRAPDRLGRGELPRFRRPGGTWVGVRP
jgi:replicative DNA helicase